MQDFENRLNEIMFVISKLVQQWQSLSFNRFKLFKSLYDTHLKLQRTKLFGDKNLIEQEFLLKSEEILRKSELINFSINKSKTILENLQQNLEKLLRLHKFVYKEFSEESFPKSTIFLLFLNQAVEQLPQLIYILEKECLFHSSTFWDFATSDNCDLHNFLCLALENQIYVENSILSYFLNENVK